MKPEGQGHVVADQDHGLPRAEAIELPENRVMPTAELTRGCHSATNGERGGGASALRMTEHQGGPDHGAYRGWPILVAVPCGPAAASCPTCPGT
jgi:hypothetical protein